MTTREQLTYERVESIIEILESSGNLASKEAEALSMTRELGEGEVATEAVENGNDPVQKIKESRS